MSRLFMLLCVWFAINQRRGNTAEYHKHKDDDNQVGQMFSKVNGAIYQTEIICANTQK